MMTSHRVSCVINSMSVKQTLKIILRALKEGIRHNEGVFEEALNVCSASNGSSKFGSESKVDISHVVVGPDESSALQYICTIDHNKRSEAYRTSVKGCPGPAYVRRMLVRFSLPPKC